MSKLQNYSIETDNTVLLQFEGEVEQRVSVGQLRKYLKGEDLRAVQGALSIRQTFLKRHLPKFAVAIAAGGLIGLVGLTQQAEINELMHQPARPKAIHRHPKLTAEAQTLPTPVPVNGVNNNSVLGTAAPTPAPTPAIQPATLPNDKTLPAASQADSAIPAVQLRIPSL